MTDALNALPAATDMDAAHRPSLRKASNLLALCVAAYRENDLDTAFDLFISGMQSHLDDVENASVGVDPRTFGEIIESALNRAAHAADEDDAAGDVEEDFDLANLTDEDLEIGNILTGTEVADEDEDDDEFTPIESRLDAMAALSAL